MQQDILSRQGILELADVDSVDAYAVAERLRGRAACGLPRENCGRNHAHNVPGIPLAASAAPRGDQVIISFAHERAVGDFIEKIAVLKIVHSRNAIRKVAVYVGYFQRVIAVYAPRGAVLAHARQGNHLPGAPVVLL